MRGRIVLVGETAADRTAVKALLADEAFEVVGEAADPCGAIDIARRLEPDFAILALGAADEAAPRLLPGMVEACPATRLIGIGSGTSRPAIEAAFKSGLLGYVVRTRAAHELLRALREVARGNLFVSPRASGVLVERYCRH